MRTADKSKKDKIIIMYYILKIMEYKKLKQNNILTFPTRKDSMMAFFGVIHSRMFFPNL
jgi:hypothetical protein